MPYHLTSSLSLQGRDTTYNPISWLQTLRLRKVAIYLKRHVLNPFLCRWWYSWASLVAQMVKHLPAMRRPGFDPCVGKIPWRRVWQPTPVLLPGKSHRFRSAVGYSPWGCKESDTTEQLQFPIFHLGWYPQGSHVVAGVRISFLFQAE